MLQRQSIATRLRKDAQRRGSTDPGGQRGIEHLHEDRAYIMPHPLVEDGDKEGAPLFWPHRALGHVVAFLKADLSVFIDALNDRDELDEVRADLVKQEAVDFQWMTCI